MTREPTAIIDPTVGRCAGGPARPQPDGFTLAELTITVGIVATVLMALFALLPISLDQVRTASTLSTGGRILGQLGAELQASGWTLDEGYRRETGSFETGLRFYDIEGQPVAAGDEVVYTALVAVDADGCGVDVVPHINGGVGNPFLLRLTVDVTDAGQVGTGFFASPDNQHRIRRYSTRVVTLEQVGS